MEANQINADEHPLRRFFHHRRSSLLTFINSQKNLRVNGAADAADVLSLSSRNNNSNNNNNNGGNHCNRLENFNKLLLLSFLSILILSPHPPNNPSSTIDEWRVPHSFQRFPTVYAGSQVLIATGFFSAFLGLISSARLRISRFCACYSTICLVFVVILFSIAFLLPGSDLLPLWVKTQLCIGAIKLTSPLSLFVVQVVLLPLVLHFSLYHV